MKRLPIVAFLALLLAAAPIFADSIDDAEAKRRGVAVEVVQLERTKQQVADLTAQVASLKAQLAAAKAPATGPATAPATAAASNPAAEQAKAIAAAIKDHKIIVGMTMAQATQAMKGISDPKPCPPALQPAGLQPGETVYLWPQYDVESDGQRGMIRHQTGTVMVAGKVVRISSTF